MTDSERAAGSERAGGPSASDVGDGDIAIELRGIVKRFPGVVANNGIELIVQRRHIHTIVGENGAGESTLMKILYGSLRPDEGTITVDGTQRAFHRRATRSRRASGWCSSISCWPTTSPYGRTLSSACRAGSTLEKARPE